MGLYQLLRQLRAPDPHMLKQFSDFFFGPDLEELLRPDSHVYYRQEEMPDQGWPDRDSPQAVRKALDCAHDNMKALVRENDRLRRVLIESQRRHRRQLGTIWTGFIGLMAWLVPFAVKGMAR